MWAVVSPRGRLLVDTVSRTMDGAVWLFLVCCTGHHPDALRAPGTAAGSDEWRNERERGYRAVRVTVRAEEAQ